ncbi:restriction endonuclease subunit S [Moraxella catarrhalis]|uniref:restriction endonuclease subunit S n=2 Tax=Moraxella catarrhalis TaxID=480 RepID=UPI0007F51E2A|nr:restriction endonuclease subunit S [Moraxella catarrhalis]OAV26636.1 Type I restriction-modification system, specificity subunit S [Moraxella catarrhalis]
MLSTVKNLFGEFMNAMIKKLLQGQAVEWRSLGEVLVRTKGTKITAGKMKELHKSNAPIKIFAGGKTFALVDFDDIPQKDINHKPSIIVKSRGIIEFEYYDKPFSHKNEMWAYHSQNPNINIKFIYYFLKQNEPYFQKIGSKMQMPQIATPDTDKFKIPIPPLSVQSHIVQILDTFTELNDQLTAELSMRQKQYQYYRDLLLSEHELAKVGFEWKTLGKLGIINRGKRVVKSQLTTEGVYPVYQNSLQPLGYFDKSNVKANTTFMITAGAAGEIGYSNCAFWSADDCYYFDCPKDVLDDRFLYHSLKKQQNKIFSQVRKASIPRLGRNSVENIKIPIPPLSVQSQIVAILDTFDTLTQSISEGLPKEIKLRQKQYEYYRERLLNFKATI